MSKKDDKSAEANTLVNKGLEIALAAIEKAETPKERKAGNKDLELFLGFDEKESFSALSFEEQESVINSYIERAQSGEFLGSADELLKGLHYRPPEATPATPTPAFSAPTPGGMGGGGKVVRFTKPPVQNNQDQDTEE